MHTYHNLRARMKGRSPPNWSPALRPKDSKTGPVIEQYGEGLVEVVPPPVEDTATPPLNQTIYQSFEWYTPSWSTPVTVPTSTTITHTTDTSATEITTTKSRSHSILPTHYAVVTSLLPSLARLGITTVLLPPGCKASNPQDNGYGVHDLYDLGEFETKGSTATKWGSKDELVMLGQRAEELGVELLWDAVLNHRAAGDGKEKARAVVVSSKDRNKELTPPHDVETWTSFTYPARAGKYSTQLYSWRHFSGIDWDASTNTKAILRFVGDDLTPKPGWSPDVAHELGNYDYLMFADVDYAHPEVQADVLNWSTWLSTQIPGLTGLRLDAIKHYSARFQYSLLKHLRSNPKTKDWFVVGEYWRADSQMLSRHIDGFAGHMRLFDVKLLYNFHDFSEGRLTDLRKILAGSLVEIRPEHAVTFVTNHDTQATQSLAAPVQPWFHAQAYALILLRSSGTPIIFHGDTFGTLGPQPSPPSAGNRLMRLCLIRSLYAYGPQHDFFVARDCIAWSREGHTLRNGGAGIAVVLCSGWTWRSVRVYVGRRHRGEVWTDLMGWSWDEVRVDERGYGVFRVGPRSVGVWTGRDALGRDVVDGLVWPPLGEEGEEDVA